MTILIGLTGRAGAGKDTVAARLAVVYGEMTGQKVERRAFADPLKNSVCALFGMDREQLEVLKRREGVRVGMADTDTLQPLCDMDFRTFLQRYGTEAHRDVFGQGFWLDKTLPMDYADFGGGYHANEFIVITDCRFVNEAMRVNACFGKVYEVVGPDGPMDPEAEHISERPLPPEVMHGYINNEVRGDAFKALDLALIDLLEGVKV